MMHSIETQIEKAFDYRGDVTIVFKEGRKVEGYLFNREAHGTKLSPKPFFDMLLPGVQESQRFFYQDVVEILFTGEDTAAGRSWEDWQLKQAGKGNAGSLALPGLTTKNG